MEINIPEVVAEVTQAWHRYQKAVDANDFDTMNELFWDSPYTVRFGPNGTLISHTAIASYRRNRPGRVIDRKLRNTVITTFGRDFAVASTLYERPTAPGKIGRQTQTWVKFPEGWRVVVGHVSLMEKPAT